MHFSINAIHTLKCLIYMSASRIHISINLLTTVVCNLTSASPETLWVGVIFYCLSKDTILLFNKWPINTPDYNKNRLIRVSTENKYLTYDYSHKSVLMTNVWLSDSWVYTALNAVTCIPKLGRFEDAFSSQKNYNAVVHCECFKDPLCHTADYNN